MHRRGFSFYLADNGVWLVDHVPPEFLSPDSP
jgi:putative RNA 2'-phosphotransferase